MGDPAKPADGAGRAFKPTPYPRATNAPLPAAPQPPRTKAQRVRYGVKVGLIVLSVVALVGTGVAWGVVNWFRGNTNTADVLSTKGEGPSANDGAEDILLVGSDSRTDIQGNPLPLDVLKRLRTEATDGVNTDTMMLLRIPRGGGKAKAISIPRDTYLNVPGQGSEKINAAYGRTAGQEMAALRANGESGPEVERKSRQAGARKLVQAVQGLTGAHIDHYAEVNLYGFYLLTNAVGGVPVCLKHATKDKDSGADFTAGWQTVSGGQALSFVRQRKNLPHGDLDRIKRQQVFLASAANQVLSAGTLTDPGKLSGLVDTVRKAMLFDNDFDITQFVQQAQGLAGGNVDFATIPVEAVGAHTEGGQSIVKVDLGAVHRFVANIFTQQTPEPQGRPAPPGRTAPAAAMAELNSPKCVD
ncbi:LCP family protein [Sciscionella marina]|uniref:LCP family protein n=1 Tax=Sciscionella marina TaxID=508770 RepID=UPI00035E5D3D|nr:LCP family protein [Sciscionella marina]